MPGRTPTSVGFGILIAGALALGSCADEDLITTGVDRLEPEMSYATRPAISVLSSKFTDGLTYQFLPWVLDDAGPNDVPEQSDVNAFTRADNRDGWIAVKWLWDDIDSWTGSGQTGDACALFDTSDPSDGNIDYAVCVRITNNPEGTQVLQLDDPESPIIYGCSGKKTDRCTKPVTGPLPLGGTYCEAALAGFDAFEEFGAEGEAGDDGDDVVAACEIPLSAIGGAASPNLANVCSFPSGEPNSNPFDCVVTPGAGFLRIQKVVTGVVAAGLTFSWNLDPAAGQVSSASAPISVSGSGGSGSTGLIAVVPQGEPNSTYSLIEILGSDWELASAGCALEDGNSTVVGVPDLATATVSGIQVPSGETAVCTFTNQQLGSIVIDKVTVGDSGGAFEFATTGADLTDFSLTTTGAGEAGKDTETFTGVSPGTYTITEDVLPSGWTLTGIQCSNNLGSTISIGADSDFDSGDTSVSIDLAAGDDVSCTYTNTKGGSIKIVKDAVPDDGQDFDFTGTGTGVDAAFILDDDGGSDGTYANEKTFSGLLPGTRTITEIGEAGWTLTNISCSSGSSTVTIGADSDFDAGDNAVSIDLAAGDDVTCTYTNTKQGSIKIVKDAVPDDGQDFDFTGTGDGIDASFALDDDADGTLSDAKTFNGLLPGTRTITETGETGWTLTNIVCTSNLGSTVKIGSGADFSGDAGFQTGDDAVSVDLMAGDDVTCTYTNTKQGSLKVVKDAVPDDGQDFDFTGTGTGVDASFVLDDDGGSDGTYANEKTFSGLLPGTRTITEAGETGWTLTNIACSSQLGSTVKIGSGADFSGDPGFQSGDDAVSVDLKAGDDVTCTYTNTKQGSLKIVKDAVPDGGEDFDFTGTGAGIDASFVLDDDGGSDGTYANEKTFNGLLPGTRTITETGETGWALTNIACSSQLGSTVTIGADSDFDPGDTSVSVDLKAGDDVVCTYTNTKGGSIKVVKDAVPNDGQDFDFTGTGTGIDASFALDDDADGTLSNEKTFNGLLPGTRTITETGETGWTLTNIACSSQLGSTVTIGADSDFDAGDASVSVDLVAGDDVVCTYTNTKGASIKVVKDAVPNDGQDFDFTGTGAGIDASFALDDDADGTLSDEKTFSGLLPGTRTITETGETGWTLTNISCSSTLGSTVTIGADSDFDAGDASVSVDLKAGDTVTCTYTNKKRGTITIDKVTSPAGLADSFTFTNGVDASGDFSLTDASAAKQFTGLEADGSYTVTEQAAANFDLTNIGCSSNLGTSTVAIGADSDFESGDDAVSITLGAGDDVTCTYTNTRKAPALVITKTPDAGTAVLGGTASFSIEVKNNGPGKAFDVVLDDTLPSDLTWSESPDKTECGVSGGNILHCDIGTLDSGASFTVSLTSQVIPSNFLLPAGGGTPVDPLQIDGNLVDEGAGIDWAVSGIDCTTVPRVGCEIDEPTGSTDNAFGKGTKEDTEVPSVVTGSIPNNKSDLLRFYVTDRKVQVNGSVHDFLYLAWERVQAPNGTTNMDFELNQSDQLSSNEITPVRTAGDLLVKYDLAKGGDQLTLGWHEWITAASASGSAAEECEASNSFPCWGKVTTLTGSAVAGAVNTASVDDPIDPDATRSLDPLTFGEAGIDLQAAGIFQSGVCRNFGSAYLKSRSSDSFNSEIKDFIAPIPISVSNCSPRDLDNTAWTAASNFTPSGGEIGDPISDDGQITVNETASPPVN